MNNPEIKKEWFLHRMYSNGETTLTITWARNKGNNTCEWEYFQQKLELEKPTKDHE